jgi:hypothetical protein
MAGTLGTLYEPAKIPRKRTGTDEQGALSGTAGVLSDETLFLETASNIRKISRALEPEPTICSQQLAHFDRDGEPLWFNGWLATHRPDDKEDVEFREFEVCARESKIRRKMGAPDPYQVQEANVVCMRSEETLEFTEEDQSTLSMLRELAKAAVIEW